MTEINLIQKRKKIERISILALVSSGLCNLKIATNIIQRIFQEVKFQDETFIKKLKEECVDDSGKKDFVLYDAWNKIDKLSGYNSNG